MIRREVLTVLFGLSGTGKTSLLRAGFFPKLREENFLPVYIRLDYSIGAPALSQQVRAGLSGNAQDREIEETQLRAPGVGAAAETLWEYLHRTEFWNKRNQMVMPLMFLDQFEEIFTLGKNRAEIEVFLNELAAITENFIP